MEAPKNHIKARNHFIDVYDTYNSDIYRFCVLKVSNKEIALDITQEVFTRFWQSMRKGTDIKNERAFLYTLARNLVIDWYRKKKEVSLDNLTDAGWEFEGNDSNVITENAEMQLALKAIQELDSDSKEVVTMRFVDGIPPSEIAIIRNESANAVSVRINRAMKKVQDYLHVHENSN
jgi:RNA polymerase sigma-70 factor (ECF subfamily)